MKRICLVLIAALSVAACAAGSSPAPTPQATATASSQATAVSATQAPTAAPTKADPTVSIAQEGKPIPGLTAADVKLNLPSFTCDGPNKLADGVIYVCKDQTDATVDYRVEFSGMGVEDIRTLTATITWYGAKSLMGAKADEFLGYIATLPYEGSKPVEAKAWVQGKASGTATFGGAKFTITTASSGILRFLTITGV